MNERSCTTVKSHFQAHGHKSEIKENVSERRDKRYLRNRIKSQHALNLEKPRFQRGMVR